MNKLLYKLFPIAGIATLIIVLAIANYVPGTMLTGWDNLHPEFNLALNIKRSIFAVWQEYQSLGLLGGMGHATDLVRQVFLLIVSSVFPNNFLRFFWTMLTLFIGGTGMFYLVKTLVGHSSLALKKTNLTVIPVVASVFYILNLATLQSYYTPFETFTAHFAFLPFLLLATLYFFNKQTIKNALLLLLVFFLTIPQSYVPTLFVVFVIAATVILLTTSYKLIKLGRPTILFKIAAKYYALLGIANAFWLLPFLYFTFTNASTNVNAKINQMATSQIISQNKEFGNPIDVMLLKGFWFNNVEPNLSRTVTYMMLPWREHLASPFIIVIGLSFFAIILVGLISAIRKKEPLLLGFAVLFIVIFTMLCNATPPFSWIDSLLNHIPLLQQAFRFPFTKFSILAGLLYALFFAIGVGTIISFVENAVQNFNENFKKAVLPVILFIVFGSILIYMKPVFTGNLFYQKEQINMPQDYNQVFSYFAKQDPTKRIATLPIQQFWSWNYYDWGYGGSGFLWYGIEQPIVDRAFDVWSATSENSYNELSYAIYSKNPQLLENDLNKYQISYLILDKHIYSSSSPKALFTGETEAILSQIKTVKKEQTFGSIEIYSVALKNKPQNFLYTTPILPSSNDYKYGDNDGAYNALGNYSVSQTPTTYIPFGSLFSNKLYNKDFTVKETDSEVVFTRKLPEIKQATLAIPSFSTEKIVPIKISSQKDTEGNTVITASVLHPTVTVGGKTVSDQSQNTYPLFTIQNQTGQYTLDINGTRQAVLDLSQDQNVTTYLQIDNYNYISLQNSQTNETVTQAIDKDRLLTLSSLGEQQVQLTNIKAGTDFSVHLPKVIDSFYSNVFNGTDFKKTQDCNAFRNGMTNSTVVKTSQTFDAKNDSICTSISVPTLPHQQGYLIHLSTKNETGDPFHFWVLNENEGTAPIDLNLDKNNTDTYAVLPVMEQYGQSYSFHLDNIATGNVETKNTVKSMSVIAIPYSFITNISINTSYISIGAAFDISSTHPNESLYTVSPKETVQKPATLILSQSYDPGWKAYQLQTQNSKLKTLLGKMFPFFFGKELNNHVKVNNWENGWTINPSIINQQSSIIIVYLPQYLEYGGFVLLILSVGILLLFKQKGKLSYFTSVGNNFFENKANTMKEKVEEIRNSHKQTEQTEPTSQPTPFLSLES